MKWDDVRLQLLDEGLEPGELVYLERRGGEYTWERAAGFDTPAELPEAWMYYAGAWPERGSEKVDAFFTDLQAELESMTGGADRCRWSPDDPYPHGH